MKLQALWITSALAVVATAGLFTRNAVTQTEVGARKAAEAKTISEPEDKPWKLREFIAADPDGNLIRVFYDFRLDEMRTGGVF